jgi:hypothetical protein
MTARVASAAPMPTPTFMLLDRALGDAEAVEVAPRFAVLVLESTADTIRVDEAAGKDVLVDSSAVLVAAQPSREMEKIVCKTAGAGATNCSFVGSSQAGLLSASTPQHCHKPDVLFQVTSGRNCDVHLFGNSGQRPELAVQPAT